MLPCDACMRFDHHSLGNAYNNIEHTYSCLCRMVSFLFGVFHTRLITRLFTGRMSIDADGQSQIRDRKQICRTPNIAFPMNPSVLVRPTLPCFKTNTLEHLRSRTRVHERVDSSAVSQPPLSRSATRNGCYHA